MSKRYRTRTLSARAPAQPFRFLELPPELRNRIYANLYNSSHHTGLDIEISVAKEWAPSSALIQTCRQIRSEALLLFEEARVEFKNTLKRAHVYVNVPAEVVTGTGNDAECWKQKHMDMIRSAPLLPIKHFRFRMQNKQMTDVFVFEVHWKPYTEPVLRLLSTKGQDIWRFQDRFSNMMSAHLRSSGSHRRPYVDLPACFSFYTDLVRGRPSIVQLENLLKL